VPVVALDAGFLLSHRQIQLVSMQNFLFLCYHFLLAQALLRPTPDMGENPGTGPIIARPQGTASQGMAMTVVVARGNGENGAARSVTYENNATGLAKSLVPVSAASICQGPNITQSLCSSTIVDRSTYSMSW
jgi:hypothetical protein